MYNSNGAVSKSNKYKTILATSLYPTGDRKRKAMNPAEADATQPPMQTGGSAVAGPAAGTGQLHTGPSRLKPPSQHAFSQVQQPQGVVGSAAVTTSITGGAVSSQPLSNNPLLDMLTQVMAAQRERDAEQRARDERLERQQEERDERMFALMTTVLQRLPPPSARKGGSPGTSQRSSPVGLRSLSRAPSASAEEHAGEGTKRDTKRTQDRQTSPKTGRGGGASRPRP